MFDPSRDQVRETFFGAWRKYRAGERGRRRQQRLAQSEVRSHGAEERKAILAALLARK